MPISDHQHKILCAYSFSTCDGFDTQSFQYGDNVLYPSRKEAVQAAVNEVLPWMKAQHNGFGTWVEYVSVQDVITGSTQFFYMAQH